MSNSQNPTNSDIPPKEWIDMNLRALDIERLEIRHWQNLIPNLTFWIITGIFALAAFALSRPSDLPPMQVLMLGIVSTVGITGLAACYWIITGTVEDNIALIRKENLSKVEKELGDCGKKLGKNYEFVYTGTGNLMKEIHARHLKVIVLVLGMATAFVVLTWSIATFNYSSTSDCKGQTGQITVRSDE